ncbi:hypothetical protein BV25DRAFT_1021712 [Artomyces pyxidatus]|uniref:Uncharacterized protein n=1 Tax=Artomyces pyxidatus TaxID=48021 RepID=A0ACB8SV81_9AGAM|nr:hypothetical protein BV25DRAFT_1021712 [Artomyces pyxidatus]
MHTSDEDGRTKIDNLLAPNHFLDTSLQLCDLALHGFDFSWESLPTSNLTRLDLDAAPRMSPHSGQVSLRTVELPFLEMLSLSGPALDVACFFKHVRPAASTKMALTCICDGDDVLHTFAAVFTPLLARQLSTNSSGTYPMLHLQLRTNHIDARILEIVGDRKSRVDDDEPLTWTLPSQPSSPLMSSCAFETAAVCRYNRFRLFSKARSH